MVWWTLQSLRTNKEPRRHRSDLAILSVSCILVQDAITMKPLTRALRRFGISRPRCSVPSATRTFQPGLQHSHVPAQFQVRNYAVRSQQKHVPQIAAQRPGTTVLGVAITIGLFSSIATYLIVRREPTKDASDRILDPARSFGSKYASLAEMNMVSTSGEVFRYPS